MTLKVPTNYISTTNSLINLIAASAADPNLFNSTYPEEEEEDDEVDDEDTTTSSDESTSTSSSSEEDDDDNNNKLSTLNISTEQSNDNTIINNTPTTTTKSNTIPSSSTPITTSSTSSTTNITRPPLHRTATNLSQLNDDLQNQSDLVKQLAIDQADAVDDAIFRAQRNRSNSIRSVRLQQEGEGILLGLPTTVSTISTSSKVSDEGSIEKLEEEDEETFSEPLIIDEEQLPTERLKKIVQEFGPWSDESEEFIQSIPGALYRGVLIKGVLALTNRRLFFFAYVPPMLHMKSVRSGPVTIHFPGLFKKSLRAWVDLTDDSVTWYKSSSTLYNPLGACRLSQLKEILPYHEDEPFIIRIDLIDGRKRILELDTVESALGWRADMEATVFTFRANADKLRLAVPLQRIQRTTVQPYMALAEKIELIFDAGICGEEASVVSNLTTIEFGYIKSHHDFAIDLALQIELSRSEVAFCGGVNPILEIDSEVRKEEDIQYQQEQERQRRLSSFDEDSISLDSNTKDSNKLKSELKLGSKFIEIFALEEQNPNELFIVDSIELVRALPSWGCLVISKSFLCFWRKNRIIEDTKLRIPLTDLDSVQNCKAFGFRIFGLSIQVNGSPDVRFDFHSKKMRDLTVLKLSTIINNRLSSLDNSILKGFEGHSINNLSNEPLSYDISPSTPTSTSSFPSPPLATPHTSPSLPFTPHTQSSYTISPLRSPFDSLTQHQTILGQNIEEEVKVPAGMKKLPIPALLNAVGRRKIQGLHFVMLTIGSRGDVQPYIALGKELIKDGNKVTIASHPEYRQWVESFGIGYREVGGDPAALMKLSIEHTLFSPAWFKESLGHFRGWLDNLYLESWNACQDADILIESPSTMAGIHVAEALKIPYFRAFTMPWSKTSVYPHAFGASVDLGPTYNSLSYAIFDGVIWKATAGQVNRFRKETLGLKPTSLHKMSQAKTPFIYNFSTALVPKPNDWRDFICISGYWFLDDDKPWTPPAGLLEFIQKARQDNKKILYVGFGSIIVPDAAALTKSIIAAVKNADVRIILSKGWSDRGGKGIEVILPEEVYSVASIPHDRLFPLIDAALHHGGAGSTGASLRAGLPTLIHPFFGDQFFWSSRVQKLGAGLKVDTLSEKDLTAAFKQGTTDRVMKEKAAQVGEKIRSENGVRTAINFITDHIHLAQERGDLRAARARKEKNKLIIHTRTFSQSGPSPTTSSITSPFKRVPSSSSRSDSPVPGSTSSTSGRPSTPVTFKSSSNTSSISGAPLVDSPSIVSTDSNSTTGSGFKWCPRKNSMRKEKEKSGRIEKEKEEIK